MVALALGKNVFLRNEVLIEVLKIYIYCNCTSGTHYYSKEVKVLGFHRINVHIQLIF